MRSNTKKVVTTPATPPAPISVAFVVVLVVKSSGGINESAMTPLV